jgi:hypothetical protein
VKRYGVKLFFAAVLALTLGLKLLVYHREFHYHPKPTVADPDPNYSLGEAVASFLVQHGFESHVEKRFNQVFVHANSEKCRMLITESDPRGLNSGTVELLAKPVGRLSYVFDGAVHEHEPSPALLLIREYWTRVSIKMGLSPSHQRTLTVAASDDCAINTLPWRELGPLS